ncbi:MAG: antitoxin VapB family protein [Candidatus Aenigmatarchaeota archaeon]
MGTKTISITDDVYGELVSVKRPEESFSDEIRRFIKAKGKISACVGLWSKWMPDEDIDEIEKNIEKRRELNRKSRKDKQRGL